MPDLRAILEKHGPVAVALLVVVYLLMHSEKRADADRAFFYNELGQEIAEVKTACQK